jgi:hypothetical protein
MLRFALYALRWQLSTPILYPIVHKFGSGFWSVAVANLIGACIFFFVDKFIFSPKVQEWEIMNFGQCADCGAHAAVRRLRYDPRGYDRRDDPNPQFRCRECSERKLRHTQFGERRGGFRFRKREGNAHA